MITNITKLFSYPQYTKNLSSKVSLGLLDEFLYNIYKLIIENTTLLDEYIFQMIAYAAQDHRRKISFLDKDLLIKNLYGVYITKNTKLFADCKFDRGLIYSILQKCMSELKEAKQLDTKLLAIDTNTQTCAAIYNPCLAYMDLYLELHHLIQTKYIKLAYREAIKASMHTQIFVDRNDLFGNYHLATIRAINKCDAQKGTLTQYIQNWFLNARNNPEFDHEYSTSFKIPSAIRRQTQQKGNTLTNFSESLEEAVDSLDEGDPLYKLFNFDPTDLKFLQQYAKEYNVAWIYYNLPYKLSEHQVSTFKVKPAHQSEN